MAANDPIRARHRDRGYSKNFLNDLQGIVGEILAIRKAQDLYKQHPVRHDICNVSGPIDEPDVIVVAPNQNLNIEAKCLLWAEGKKFFLINALAHQRSIGRNASHYYPTISAPGCDTAFTAPLIPSIEVAEWEIKDFGYGDPAHAISLEELCRSHFRFEWRAMRSRLSDSGRVLYSMEELMQIHDAGVAKSTEVRELLETSREDTIRDLINKVSMIIS